MEGLQNQGYHLSQGVDMTNPLLVWSSWHPYTTYAQKKKLTFHTTRPNVFFPTAFMNGNKPHPLKARGQILKKCQLFNVNY